MVTRGRCGQCWPMANKFRVRAFNNQSRIPRTDKTIVYDIRMDLKVRAVRGIQVYAESLAAAIPMYTGPCTFSTENCSYWDMRNNNNRHRFFVTVHAEICALD